MTKWFNPRRTHLATIAGATALAIGVVSVLPASAEHGLDHGPRTIPDGPLEFDVLSGEGGTWGEVYLIGQDDPIGAQIWVSDGPNAWFGRALTLSVDASQPQGAYVESSWADAGLDTNVMSKVQWIISLGTEAGQSVWTGGSGEFEEPLRSALVANGLAEPVADELAGGELVAGVQAAIWHFTEGVEMDPARADADVLALYEFLTGPANADVEEPQGLGWLELALTPEHIDGERGTLVGPFELTTNAAFAEVSAHEISGAGEHMRVVDSAGNDTTGAFDVADGAELFLDVPDELGASEGTIDARAWREFAGRAAVGGGNTLIILNYSEEVMVTSSVSWDGTDGVEDPVEQSADPTATPSSEPSPQAAETLPDTGARSLVVLIALALAFIAGGSALVVNNRRRMRQATE